MKTALIAVMLMALAASVAAQQAPPPAEDEKPATTLKVDVKLVNVFVTVVDEHGAPVAGLTQEDFQLTEDGVSQRIAVFERESALPLSIVLAMDTSLSTRKDIRLERESARRFVRSILRPVDRLELFQFAEDVDLLVPFTADLKRIDRGIDRLRLGAATALFDAIYLASDSLLDRRGRKVLVLISDGGDTVSKTSYAQALRAAQEAEAIVYSIIVVPISAQAGRNTGGEHALIKLSQDTGGKHYYADSIAGLDRAFAEVSSELRTQYLLAYYPKQRLSDSEFRRIDVSVREPNSAGRAGLRARHRSGYYTSSPR